MYYVGVDLGGTNIRAGLVDEGGRIIEMSRMPTQRGRGYRDIVRDIADMVRGLLEKSGIRPADIAHIGIGIPGAVDCAAGILIYANNFDFENAPIAGELQKYFDLPVFLQNDANCSAIGESVAGSAKDVSDSITVTLGTGIGGGIILGGKIYSGFNGVGGELGHMVIKSGGERCTCGRRGCWEAYASATGMIKLSRKAAIDNPDSLLWKFCDGNLDEMDAQAAFRAEKEGDKAGSEAVSLYVNYLSEGLVNLVNIFMPELIIIGGGVSRQGENLFARVREKVKKDKYFKGEPSTDIVCTLLEDRAGIVGAAMVWQYV